MSAHPLPGAAENSVCWQWLTSADDAAADRRVGPPDPRGRPGAACVLVAATHTVAGDLARLGPARDFARSALLRWGLTDSCDDIVLVASELLGNALRHARPRPGGWPVRLGLLHSWPGRVVLCAVADSDPAPPVPVPPGQLAESGRGLRVVEELSDRWGYSATPGGKVVWAVLTGRR